MRGLVRRNPGEVEFHQAVREFVESAMPFVAEHPEYERAQILEHCFKNALTGLPMGGAKGGATSTPKASPTVR